jgi:hypothetical protein
VDNWVPVTGTVYVKGTCTVVVPPGMVVTIVKVVVLGGVHVPDVAVMVQERVTTEVVVRTVADSVVTDGENDVERLCEVNWKVLVRVGNVLHDIAS